MFSRSIRIFSKTISESTVAFVNDSDSDANVNVEDDEIVSIHDSDNESVDQPVNVLSGKLLKELTRVPKGKTLQEHLEDLKNRKSAKEQHSESIKHSIDIVRKRFSRLDLNGRRLGEKFALQT